MIKVASIHSLTFFSPKTLRIEGVLLDKVQVGDELKGICVSSAVENETGISFDFCGRIIEINCYGESIDEADSVKVFLDVRLDDAFVMYLKR